MTQLPTRTCQHCGAQTTPYSMTRPGVNHVLHLLATVFLCGLWAPVWAVMALNDTGGVYWVCSHCDKVMGKQ